MCIIYWHMNAFTFIMEKILGEFYENWRIQSLESWNFDTGSILIFRNINFCGYLEKKPKYGGQNSIASL